MIFLHVYCCILYLLKAFSVRGANAVRTKQTNGEAAKTFRLWKLYNGAAIYCRILRFIEVIARKQLAGVAAGAVY